MVRKANTQRGHLLNEHFIRSFVITIIGGLTASGFFQTFHNKKLKTIKYNYIMKMFKIGLTSFDFI